MVNTVKKYVVNIVGRRMVIRIIIVIQVVILKSVIMMGGNVSFKINEKKVKLETRSINIFTKYDICSNFLVSYFPRHIFIKKHFAINTPYHLCAINVFVSLDDFLYIPYRNWNLSHTCLP